LRDFTGYTLVTKPAREPVDRFIEHYKSVLGATFTVSAKVRKLVDDLPRLLSSGVWESAMVDVLHQCGVYSAPHPDRTYLAGSDVPPPEVKSVPLTEADFDSEDEYHAVMKPWQVTNAQGQVLPPWTQPTRVFDRKGRISAEALQLVASAAV
jgi:hypothetical protein